MVLPTCLSKSFPPIANHVTIAKNFLNMSMPASGSTGSSIRLSEKVEAYRLGQESQSYAMIGEQDGKIILHGSCQVFI